MVTNKKTVLFVEDNPVVLAIYRDCLQRDGIHVESAEDGKAALDCLPLLKPDLVILDLMLPKLNGLDVLKFIRKHPNLQATPVMILSNAYMDDMASKAMTAGANARMLKTECSPARLIENVRELLGLPRAPQAKSVPQNGAATAEPQDAWTKKMQTTFLADAPEEIARIRSECVAFVRTAGLPASKEHLSCLYQQVRLLGARAGLGTCPKIARLVSALEALIYEVISKQWLSSGSIMQTIAQAVDCLDRLFQRGDVHSADESFKAKVLIVDDDPICNFATMAAMKRAKLDAVGTQDPVAALKLAEAETFGLVLLDINMPGVNGFEVCEKLRLLPEYKSTPVIFVTSYSEFQNRAQAVLSGGNDLIAKPIFPLELVLKTVMHLIEPPGPRANPSSACAKTNSVAASAVAGMAAQIKLPTDDSPEAAEPENAGVPLSANDLVDPGLTRQNDEPMLPVTEGVNQRPTRLALAPIPEGPAPAIFAADPIPFHQIHPPKNGATHEVLMKNEVFMKSQNEDQRSDEMTRQVVRIIFGDETVTEVSQRLTRIALERYNVLDTINSTPDPGIRVNNANPAGANGDPFHKVASGVARLLFGDEGVSDMHLRLTRIALERYHVPEIISRPLNANKRNGSLEANVPKMVV